MKKQTLYIPWLQLVRHSLLWACLICSVSVNAQSLYERIKELVPSIPVETQFLEAVKVDNSTFVKKLLDNGVQPMQAKSSYPHNSALHIASWENALKSLAILLAHPAVEVDILNAVNETPLMIASLQGNVTIVNMLLDKGAYPNKPGWSALHYAATHGHIEVMRVLLEAHALIDAQSPNNTTPLMMAAQSKNILAVKFLLDEGADASLKNDQGLTAIDFAVKANALDIANGLTERLKKLQERANKPAWLR